MRFEASLNYFKKRRNKVQLMEEECAIYALEKQIPKKPLNICTPVVTWGLCPVCKGELNKLGNRPNRVFKNQVYCSDCGQALDWSDTSEKK